MGKWQKHCILTNDDGAIFETIYAKYGCDNVSQFYKKVVHGQIRLIQVRPIKIPTPVFSQGFSSTTYQSKISLTKNDGEIFTDIIKKNNVENPSQLCRKIANGELILIKPKVLQMLIEMSRQNIESVLLTTDDK